MSSTSLRINYWRKAKQASESLEIRRRYAVIDGRLT
jgi:hypothetical protein